MDRTSISNRPTSLAVLCGISSVFSLAFHRAMLDSLGLAGNNYTWQSCKIEVPTTSQRHKDHRAFMRPKISK